MTTEPTWLSTDQPNLIQHSGNGRYYARYALAGRRHLKALKTSKLAVAKQKLRETLFGVEKARAAGVATIGDPAGVRMGALAAEFLSNSKSDTNLSEATKLSHIVYVRRLEKTWPGFDGLRPAAITVKATRDWVHRVHSFAEHCPPGAKTKRHGYSASSINHTLGVLAELLKMAVSRGALLVAPLSLEVVRELRRKVVPRVPELPARADMAAVFDEMGKCPTRLPEQYQSIKKVLDDQAADGAEFARFMAYTGARLAEAAEQVWEDVGTEIIVIRGTKTDGSLRRDVPLIPQLKDLLASMRARRGGVCVGKLFAIRECDKNLTRACKAIGVKRLKHHDLRHYFATACIESGIDIPTVSRWLGHVDGGVVCMKVYGHLRQEHSIAAAARVVA